MEIFQFMIDHVRWFMNQTIEIGGFQFNLMGAIVFGAIMGVFLKVVEWLFNGDF